MGSLMTKFEGNTRSRKVRIGLGGFKIELRLLVTNGKSYMGLLL